MILSKNKHRYLLASWNNETHTCQNHGFHNLRIYNNSKIEVFLISSVRASFSQWLNENIVLRQIIFLSSLLMIGVIHTWIIFRLPISRNNRKNLYYLLWFILIIITTLTVIVTMKRKQRQPTDIGFDNFVKIDNEQAIFHQEATIV